jgi:hypothetical protein
MSLNLSSIAGRSKLYLSNQLITLAASVSTLSSSVGTAIGNITSLTSSLTTTNSNVTTLQGNVTTIDTNISNLDSQTGYGTFSAATYGLTASSLVARDPNGQVNVAATPTANNHAASKTYVDNGVANAIPSVSNGGTESASSFNAVGNTHYAINLSSNSVEAILPDATTIPGQIIEFYIKAIGSGNSLYFGVAIPGQTINELTASTFGGPAELYGVMVLRSIGGEYRVVGRC